MGKESIQLTENEKNRTLYSARWIGTVILFGLGIINFFNGVILMAIVWSVIVLNLCPKTYPRVKKFNWWFIALIVWMFGIRALFSANVLLAIILIIVGVNICPATAAKTISKEKEIWSKIKIIIED